MIKINTTIQLVPKPTNYKFKDIEGRTFGRLRVISYTGSIKKKSLWICLCECGNYTRVVTGDLTTGHTQSCGCYLQEQSLKSRTKHQDCSSAKYRSFHSAKNRCNNPNNQDFYSYGKRGVEFRFKSYEEFLMEVGRKPSPKHSLDRINVNGHYEIGNCRWATVIQQGRNKRRCRKITINHVTRHLSEWITIYKQLPTTVYHRIKNG